MITVNELRTTLDKLEGNSKLRITNASISVYSADDNQTFIGYINILSGQYVPAFNAPDKVSKEASKKGVKVTSP